MAVPVAAAAAAAAIVAVSPVPRLWRSKMRSPQPALFPAAAAAASLSGWAGIPPENADQAKKLTFDKPNIYISRHRTSQHTHGSIGQLWEQGVAGN
jgi:hypothetical protein